MNEPLNTRRSVTLSAAVTTAGILLVTACGDGGPRADPALETPGTDSAGVRVVEIRVPEDGGVHYARLSPRPTLTLSEPQEGVPGWSRVRIRGATTLADGRIAVGDHGSFRVRYYTGDQVTWSVGGRGSGPLRFMGIFGLGRAAGDTVWVSDPVDHELTLLDPAGEESLEGEVPGEFTAVGRFGDGSFLTIRPSVADEADQPPLGVRRDSVVYRRWWPYTGDTATVGIFPGNERLTLETDPGERVTLPPPLASGTSLAVGPGRFYAGDQGRGEIRGYDADGTLRQIIRLRVPGRAVTPELLAGLTLTDSEGEVPPWADDFWSYASELRPAFGRILLDGTGNIWVSEYVPSGQPPDLWWILSPDGVLLGRVEVPTGVTLLEVGADHLLGLGSPAQDVRRYSLERGGR